MSITQLETDGPVARLTLCRPAGDDIHRPRLWAELRETGRRLPGSVRCLVLRLDDRPAPAEVDDLDRAGGDIAASGDEAADALLASYQDSMSWLRRADLISVAAIAGRCADVSLHLALACDLRILTVDGTLRVGEPERGLVPASGSALRLVELVGYARAAELCLTGRAVGAAEAVRTGLATTAVPRAELDDATADLVAAILAAPREATIETKALLCRATSATEAELLAAERAAQLRLLRDRASAAEQ